MAGTIMEKYLQIFQIDENRIFYKTLIFFPPEKWTMPATLQSLPVLFACKTV
jgi:hypothetical protein